MKREKPEECDNCGFGRADLKPYDNTRKVDWLCPYCANAHDMEKNKTLCSLMNVLERRLSEKIERREW